MEDSLNIRIEIAFKEYVQQVRAGQPPDIDEFLSTKDPKERTQLLQIIHNYHELREGFSEKAKALEPGAVIGGFRLYRELGRGGMAVVWEAEEIDLKRKVALKILSPPLVIDEGSLQRFQREARAGAKLTHPGIVQTHYLSAHENFFFIVQELVPGGSTLATWIEEVRTARETSKNYYRNVAKLFIEISEALHSAHLEGIIHRDIKPSNILICPNGKPKVADFGLAWSKAEITMSKSGDFRGTPSYASPEQLAGKRIGADHRIDIFSLGVTLYECLSLQRPFDGDLTVQVFNKIVHKDPPPLASLRSQIPKDLITICNKSIEKDPSHRYQDMVEFGEDLRRFLQGEPILAKPPGPIVVLSKWIRRHPVKAASLAIIGVALITITSLSWLMFEQRNFARRSHYASCLRASILSEQAGSFEEARRLLLDAPDEYRSWEWDHLLLKVRESQLLYRHERPLNTIESSPSGRYIASCSTDGVIQIWDDTENERIGSFQLTEERDQDAMVTSLCFDAREEILAFGTAGGELHLWDFEQDDAPNWLGRQDGKIRALSFLPDSFRLAVASANKQLQLWNTRQRDIEGEAVELESDISDLTVSSDGSLIATGCQNGSTQIWRSDGLQRMHTFGPGEAGHSENITQVAFHPTSNELVSASEDASLRVWDTETGALLHTLEGHNDVVIVFAITPDGNRLASGSLDNTVRLWDLKTGHQIPLAHTGGDHRHFVNSVSFDKLGSTLLSGSKDAMIKIWSTAGEKLVRTIQAHNSNVMFVRFSENNDSIISASKTGDIRRSVLFPADRFSIPNTTTASFSPDGRWIASGSPTGAIHVWDAVRGIERASFELASAPIRTLKWTADGKRLMGLAQDGQVGVFSLDQAEEVLRFRVQGQLGNLYYSDFDRQGRLLVIPNGGIPKVWDLASGDAIRSFPKHGSWVTALAVHPDGNRVLSCGIDNTLRLWNPRTAKELKSFKLDYRVNSILFSNDGRHAFLGRTDNKVALLDLDSGQTVRTYSGHMSSATASAVHPLKNRLCTGSELGEVKVWNRETGEEMLSISARFTTPNPAKFTPHRIRRLEFDPVHGKRLLCVTNSQYLVVYETDRDTSHRSAVGASLRGIAEDYYLLKRALGNEDSNDEQIESYLRYCCSGFFQQVEEIAQSMDARSKPPALETLAARDWDQRISREVLEDSLGVSLSDSSRDEES